MSVDQKDKIDFVGISEDGKQIRLTISDHLDWSHEKEHLYALQEKVNAYVAFIESGQIRDYSKKITPDSINIKIYFLHEPTNLVYEFLEHTKKVLSSIPVTLDFVKVDKTTLESIENP